MNVNVLSFGIAKDITGTSSTVLAVEEGMTVAQLRNLLENKYPQLKQLSTYMIALNNEYATDDQVVGANDELAIIPPVSGG